MTGWFALEFTVNEISSLGLIHVIYSNGSTPNGIVSYDHSKTSNRWDVRGTYNNTSITTGDRVRIEWTSGTVKVYLNDTLLATGTHSVTLPTAIEFHTGSNRYIRIKDLIVETL